MKKGKRGVMEGVGRVESGGGIGKRGRQLKKEGIGSKGRKRSIER